MQRTTGRDVATRLVCAEDALDAALIHSSDGFVRNHPVVRALDQARARLGSARHALTALADRMGLEPLAVGPLDKPEDNPPIGGGPRRARRVPHT